METSIAANQVLDIMDDVMLDLKNREKWSMIRRGMEDLTDAIDDLAEALDVEELDCDQAITDLDTAANSDGLDKLSAEAADLIRAAMVAVIGKAYDEVKKHA